MVFCRKPISKPQRQERKLQRPVFEKSRICICGNFQENFYEDTSTTNVDAHLVRLMLAVNSDRSGQNVLASTDVRNAFLNATIDENAPIVLVRPPSELVKMGIVDSSTLWRCTKACYGLKESPKMWESHRDAALTDFQWHQGGLQYYLHQSLRHPSMWYIMQGKPTSEKKRRTPGLDDGEVPRSFDALKRRRVGTFIVYVDDLLAVGKKSVLETFFKKIQTVWEIATPEHLTREPGC
eukprot:5553955-Amphidinium_carterae.2